MFLITTSFIEELKRKKNVFKLTGFAGEFAFFILVRKFKPRGTTRSQSRSSA